MGPRPFSRGNMQQLGYRQLDAGASMGPRPFSRGNASISRRWPRCVRRFNGATAFQPWKCLWLRKAKFSVATLQWGHGLSAVEISPCPPCLRGVIHASMGPRPFSRGNLATIRRRGCSSSCFNGATAFQPWKCLRGGTFAVDRVGSFNGATAFQPWKSPRRPASPFAGSPLQWGHGLSAVEIGFSSDRPNGRRELQWGHGLSAVEIRPHLREHRVGFLASMGPRPFSRGNEPRPTAARDLHAGASMGPRPFSRGNDSAPTRFRISWGRLQWGHGLSAVEIRCGFCLLALHHLASMGPRPFSRGNAEVLYG